MSDEEIWANKNVEQKNCKQKLDKKSGGNHGFKNCVSQLKRGIQVLTWESRVFILRLGT